MALNSADSAAHGFWFDNTSWPVSQWMRDATYYTRQQSYDSTDVNTFDVVGYAPDTDVWVLEWDVAGYWCGYDWHNDGTPEENTVGIGPCMVVAVNPANACEQFWIVYDHSWTYDPATSVWGRIALACHEIGHTLGMEHAAPTSTSCMVEDVDPSKSTISAVDAFFIDFFYQ